MPPKFKNLRRCKMPRDKIVEMIELVKDYPHLYDPSAQHHSSQSHCQEAWGEIVEKLNMEGFTIPSAKARWRNKRDDYRRKYKKDLHDIAKYGSVSQHKNVYDHALSFMDDVLKQDLTFQEVGYTPELGENNEEEAAPSGGEGHSDSDSEQMSSEHASRNPYKYTPKRYFKSMRVRDIPHHTVLELLVLIKGEPVLYDPLLMKGSQERVAQAWEEIVRKLNIPGLTVALVKEKWRNQRDCYRKKKKQEMQEFAEKGRITVARGPYYEKLTFLDPIMLEYVSYPDQSFDDRQHLTEVNEEFGSVSSSQKLQSDSEDEQISNIQRTHPGLSATLTSQSQSQEVYGKNNSKRKRSQQDPGLTDVLSIIDVLKQASSQQLQASNDKHGTRNSKPDSIDPFYVMIGKKARKLSRQTQSWLEDRIYMALREAENIDMGPGFGTQLGIVGQVVNSSNPGCTTAGTNDFQQATLEADSSKKNQNHDTSSNNVMLMNGQVFSNQVLGVQISKNVTEANCGVHLVSSGIPHN